MAVVLAKAAYSPREIADLFGISRSSVYELMNRGEIPSFRLGRRRLIPLAWVEEKLANVSQAAPAPKVEHTHPGDAAQPAGRWPTPV